MGIGVVAVLTITTFEATIERRSRRNRRFPSSAAYLIHSLDFDVFVFGFQSQLRVEMGKRERDSMAGRG